MKYLIEFVIAFLAVGLTYVITSEGLWGAALVFFNVLFAAMISFNFYEPLAQADRLDRHQLGLFRYALHAGLVLRVAPRPADDDGNDRSRSW